MNSSKLFVGWAAVSSQPQASEEKVSLTDQLYDNILHSRKYGKMLCQLIVPGESRNITLFEDAARTVNGWCITDTFDDLDGDDLTNAIDSKLQALRHAETINPYAELKRLLDDHAFDVFAFRNLGRVGRDAALSLTIIRLCQNADVITYATASPPRSLDSAGSSYQSSLLDAITAVGYENEIHELRERHRTGMLGRVERGLFPGRTPWGWIEVRNAKGKIDHYEIDEDAARTIREVFKLYAIRGWGDRQIADRLNRLGYPPPASDKWDRWNIDSIIEKVWRYAGYGEINVKSKRRKYLRSKGAWPPILDEDLAKAAIEEQKSRSTGPRIARHNHRFARMVFCATCGWHMISHNNVTHHVLKNGEKRTYSTRGYWCHRRHGLVAETKIDKAIRDAIDNLIKHGHEVGEVGVPQSQVPSRNLQDEIDSIQERIAKTKAGVTRADSDLYVHGTLDAERHAMIVKAAKDALNNLYAELTELEDLLLDEEQDNRRDERIGKIIKTGFSMLDHEDIQMANAWLRRHFKVVATSRKVVKVQLL